MTTTDLDTIATRPTAVVPLGQITAVEQARAVAEVQAAVVVAQQVPRSMGAATADMRDACGRLGLVAAGRHCGTGRRLPVNPAGRRVERRRLPDRRDGRRDHRAHGRADACHWSRTEGVGSVTDDYPVWAYSAFELFDLGVLRDIERLPDETWHAITDPDEEDAARGEDREYRHTLYGGSDGGESW
jgi:hypothetical protein